MDTAEMQRVRYWAKKNGFTIFKIYGGYLLFNKENGSIADKFSLKPQPLSALKIFLAELEIEKLEKQKDNLGEEDFQLPPLSELIKKTSKKIKKIE